MREIKKKPPSEPTCRKKEKEGKNERNHIWDISVKISVIFSILNVIIMVANIVILYFNYQANLQIVEINRSNLRLQEELLRFQQMVSNFTPVLNVNAETHAFFESSLIVTAGYVMVEAYGRTAVEIEVISPHWGEIRVIIKNFTEYEETLDPNMLGKNNISIQDKEASIYRAIPGLTLIHDELRLSALIYPKEEEVPKIGELRQFGVGWLEFEVQYTDYQSRVTLFKKFTVGAMLTIDKRGL